MEHLSTLKSLQWSSDLNKRRFELIDRDLQGLINMSEQIELAALTQLMREQVETEANLPFAGARKLHRSLTSGDADR